jgi:hypothetical protein
VTSGDTVACRIAHAGLARAAPNPHCWNAGPFGYGACGEPCEGFCDIAAGMHPQCSLANGFCSPAGGFGSGAPPYSSQGDCILHCALYPRINTSTNLIQPPGMVGLDGGYSANGPATGNTLDCREYHLMSGLRGGAAQQMECPLAGPDSPACR